MKKRSPVMVFAGIAVAMSGWANAALYDRGNGLIYDDVLEITWLQDAGLGGERTWDDAVAWANALVFAGFDDWRLPSMDVNGDGTVVHYCGGGVSDVACRDNELAYMYYKNLGGTFRDNLTGNQGLIQNIPQVPWSGTEYAPNNRYVWLYDFNYGDGGYSDKSLTGRAAWAVRSGDVSAVPVPSAVEYLPLQTGNQWTYETNGVPEGTQRVLPGTYDVNGVATRKLSWYPSSDAQYWTNDAAGVRIHRLDSHDPGTGFSHYLVFSPPLMQLPAEFAVGDVVTGTGTATFVSPGTGSFSMNYVWTNQIEALETLTVPVGAYPAVRCASSLRFYDQYDDFTSQSIDWYARYVGLVKWMSINEGSTTVLTAIWVDTDGDGINVVDDNCPEDRNPDQIDTDGDGIGNACDADSPRPVMTLPWLPLLLDD